MSTRHPFRFAAITCAAALVLSGCGSEEWTPETIDPGESQSPVVPTPTDSVDVNSSEMEPGSECEKLVSEYVNSDRIRQLSDPPELECLARTGTVEKEGQSFIFTFTQAEEGHFVLKDQVLYPTAAAPSPSASPSPTPSKKPKPSVTAAPKKKTKKPKPSVTAAPKKEPKPTVTVTATPEPDESGLRSAVSTVLDLGSLISARVDKTGKYPASVKAVKGATKALGSLQVETYKVTPAKKPSSFELCVSDDSDGWALYRFNEGLVGFGLTGAKCEANL